MPWTTSPIANIWDSRGRDVFLYPCLNCTLFLSIIDAHRLAGYPNFSRASTRWWNKWTFNVRNPVSQFQWKITLITLSMRACSALKRVSLFSSTLLSFVGNTPNENTRRSTLLLPFHKVQWLKGKEVVASSVRPINPVFDFSKGFDCRLASACPTDLNRGWPECTMFEEYRT